MSSSPKVCPFCDQEMRFSSGPTLADYSCQNEVCNFHKMPRYSITYSEGILAVERIILSDSIYILIEHLRNRTTISKLEVVLISDHVIIQSIININLKDPQKAIDKVKTLLLFS
jgi:hypothetical protein